MVYHVEGLLKFQEDHSTEVALLDVIYNVEKFKQSSRSYVCLPECSIFMYTYNTGCFLHEPGEQVA